MKQTKRILRIVFIMASIGSLAFVPWILVKAWILPLSGTVQEQVNDAIGHGFDGMIVYVGEEQDFKTEEQGMLASAADVGIFLRALNDGSLFDEAEREIYFSIYVYEHTGLVLGYQSIAKYHKDIDTIVIQFVNTTDFSGYTFNLSEIIYNRIIKILSKQ